MQTPVGEEMGQDRQTLAQLFAARHATSPVGFWSAPGRVNLIGEHTDYNDGFALPFAIDRRVTVVLGARDDALVRVSSTRCDQIVEIGVHELAPEALVGWSAYPLGVAWALAQQAGTTPRGFDVLIDSTVPSGAGLSSSAAIECAMAVALNEFWDLGLSREQLARVGQTVENQVVGAPTGILDQAAAMFGQPGAAVLLDCRNLHTRAIPLRLEAEQLEVLVIDTRVTHAHASGEYAARHASCEYASARMGVASLRELTIDDLPRMQRTLDEQTFRRARHVLTENVRVAQTARLLQEVGPRAIGSLLNASHTSMRDDFEISCPELDLAVDTAQRAGALGARMTGGGFGGSAIAVIPSCRRTQLHAAVTEAFAAANLPHPDIFTVQPSQGATLNGQRSTR